MKLLFIIFFSFQLTVFAYNLDQECYENKGVLVCKPTDISITISNLLTINRILSIDDYIIWLKNNIKYLSDNGDYWQSPTETLNKKTGDCEDFAFLSQVVLNYMGYKAEVWAVRGYSGAHAICIFKNENGYNIISNNELRIINAQSIKILTKYIFDNTDTTTIFKLNFFNKKREILFVK